MNLTVKATENQVESNADKLNAAPRRLRNGLCALLTGGIALVLAACEPSPASQALADKDNVAVDQPPAAQIAATDETAAPSVIIEELPTRIESTEETTESDLRHGEATRVANSKQSPGPGDVGPPTAIRPAAMMMPVEKPGRFELLGQTVPAGTSQRLMWSASQIFEGVSSATPVLVVNGKGNGPTLCLTAAIHGDELNGIEMVRRVLHDLDPDKVNGTVIGIPIVNLQGFRRGSRYLPDRRDLNRYFPGNPEGSSASRIAHSLFDGIIRHCDALVDLHTGSFYRTNMPQLRADLRYERIKEMTQGFGGIAVLHSEAAVGTLRRAAADAGIPAITLEAGEPLRLQSAKVSQGVTGIFTLLDSMNIVKRVQFLSPPEPVFYQSTWVRADDGGILFSVVRLGQAIEIGDVLGTITDPITNEQNLIYSPARGRVLGMALNQVVQPGFAAFRIGIETDGPPTESTGGDLAWSEQRRILGENAASSETDPRPTDVEAEENSEE
ncbi:MAG: succinylglutamate desuccinylase/aspartoacylase family protein [Gammaproteobacteria bacterium]|nr:succinylglutamate desuccinylase/aspartoacylase family protein [Gammaproteobacteria bacterium]